MGEITFDPAARIYTFTWRALDKVGLATLQWNTIMVKAKSACCGATVHEYYHDGDVRDSCSKCMEKALGNLRLASLDRASVTSHLQSWSYRWAEQYEDPLSATLTASRFTQSAMMLLDGVEDWLARENHRAYAGDLDGELSAAWQRSENELRALCLRARLPH